MRKLLIAGIAALALLMPGAAMAQTLPGFEIGPEAFWYGYREPNFVVQWGYFVGLDGSYTFTSGGFFAKFEGIGDIGLVDYKSASGRLNNIWNYKGEVRMLLGGDLQIGARSYLSPYAGFGYRILFENLNGRVTSLGALGYDRLSQYFYIPLGAGLTLPLGATWQVRPSAEYDFFLHGTQVSYVSQAGLPSDITNQQNTGYGARAELLFEGPAPWGAGGRIAFGPFIRWWLIGASVPSFTPLGGNLFLVGTEPHNNTLEAGLTLRFGF